MTFQDIFKKSFTEGFASTQIGTKETIVALTLTAVLGIYIFFCYCLLTRKTFYSKNFNISLVAIALITAGIILTIQSSVVISLGMVGALSIVRFRTAIKDPMDLIFLFWAISIGIICGAGMTEIAVILTLLVTAVLFVLDFIPIGKCPMILVINANCTNDMNQTIERILKKHCKYYKEKSRNISHGQLDLVMELRIKGGIELTQELSEVPDIFSVSLLNHDGEVTF